MLFNVVRRTTGVRNIIPLLSSVRGKAAYEGEGKSTVKVINHDFNYGLMINAYATYGFKLNNGLTVLGPMAIFAKTVLSWQVEGGHNITAESLRLFKLLEPKIDLLVIGVDSSERSVLERTHAASRAAGLSVEVLPTAHACSTFNFLNAEGRSVAGALLPPLLIHNMSEDDMLATKMHYHDFFKSDNL